MFNRNKSVSDIDAAIQKLTQQRQTFLTRRDEILLSIADNPDKADSFQREWTRVDMSLQAIAPAISKLEQEREVLNLKSRKAEYEQCCLAFQKERALAERIGLAQRREVIRANLMPGQYVRLVNQQAEIVSGYQQRALALLKTLDMTPNELDSARTALQFSRLDIAAMDINQHSALHASMLPEIIAELEKQFGIKLEVVNV